MRLHAVSSTIENGFVYLPDEAEWPPEYLHELRLSPRGNMTIRWTRPQSSGLYDDT
jgi:phage terminase large subunit-like protein